MKKLLNLSYAQKWTIMQDMFDGTFRKNLSDKELYTAEEKWCKKNNYSYEEMQKVCAIFENISDTFGIHDPIDYNSKNRKESFFSFATDLKDICKDMLDDMAIIFIENDIDFHFAQKGVTDA